MKLRVVYTFFFSFLSITMLLLFTGYSTGPASTVGQGYTGAPGEAGQVCGTCHNLAGAFGTLMVNVTSNGSVPEYNSAAPTPLEVEVVSTSGVPGGYGFQFTVLDADDNPIDANYSNLSDNVKMATAMNGYTYLEHNGISDVNTFTFDFQPSVTSGTTPSLKIYATGTAVNRDGTTAGDSGSPSFSFDVEHVPLAVTLSSFKAGRTTNGVRLNWTTETETDNDFFAVEHSTNGMEFSTLKTIDGTGNSSERNAYSYLHQSPVNGANYYRLRMVEYSGKVTYSDIVVQKLLTFGTVTAYPQPAIKDAVLYVNSSVEESAMMTVYDLSGRVIEYKNIELERGDNLIELNCGEWIPNHYIISISSEQLGEEITRFVKQ